VARRCAFCGSSDPLSNEHVFADWIGRSLGVTDAPGQQTMGRARNPVPTPSWSGTPFQMTVGSVCADCNNGWISRLETETSRILGPMLSGTPRRPTSDDQTLLPRWVLT
jgi:hypothetical protein